MYKNDLYLCDISYSGIPYYTLLSYTSGVIL